MNPAYSLIMIAAVATGAVLMRRSRGALALPAYQRWGVAVGAFCGAMLGAKPPAKSFWETDDETVPQAEEAAA